MRKDFVKLKWGELAKLPFILRERKISLLEAEANAPNRELAFISMARTELINKAWLRLAAHPPQTSGKTAGILLGPSSLLRWPQIEPAFGRVRVSYFSLEVEAPTGIWSEQIRHGVRILRASWYGR